MRFASWKSLATALLALAFATPSAQATPFTVSGHVYDITTRTVTFAGHESLFQSNPWWHNSVLAVTFAGVVANSLGFPNFGSSGPYFGYQDYTDPNDPTISGGTFSMFSGFYEVGLNQTSAHESSPALSNA